jgi:endonuclease/exonuclease/phosphatase family metal-dependent hydrolase
MRDLPAKFMFVGLALALLFGCPGGQPEPPDQRVHAPTAQPHIGSLRLVSLNIAHGRNGALNQVLLGKSTFEGNLRRIADLLIDMDAHVVALQEADGPSRWSGGFDHVSSLARDAGYPWFERASHAQNWLFDYGTALLSRLPFEEVLSYTFEPSPPTNNKGLLLAQIAWQSENGKRKTHFVDILSVHLDFSRQKIREQQVKEMVEVLRKRHHPSIVLGDFNSEWSSEASTVKALAEQAGFKVYRPEARNLGTYKGGTKRLDWILISKEFEFLDYRVSTDLVSDHHAVYAEIGLR